MIRPRWISALVLLTPSLALAQVADVPTPAGPPDAEEAEATEADDAPVVADSPGKEAADDDATEAAAEKPAEPDETAEADAETAGEEATGSMEATDAESDAVEATQAPTSEARAADSGAVDCPECPPSQIRELKPWEEEGGAEFDWVLIDTNEWLKGTVKELRDGSIVFNSANFGELTFSWSSIHKLWSNRDLVFVTEDKETYEGKARMEDGQLVLVTAAGEVELEQANVLSVVEATTREIENYDFKSTLSATWREGNTESIDYALYARLRREDAFNRARIEYNGAFGEVAGETNTNKHRGNAAWDLFISRIFYVTPLLGDIMYDEFQNLDTRWTVGSGVGFHAIDQSPFTLDLELAGGFTQTNFISVEAGDDEQLNDALVRPRLYFKWNVSDGVDWEIDWTSSLLVTNIERSFHHGESRLSVGLTDILDLDYAVIYDRQETPQQAADGETPVKNDLAMTLGLGVDLN